MCLRRLTPENSLYDHLDQIKKAGTKQLAPLRPDMKVLYMSGYTDDAIVHHGVLEEGVAFIGKPFSIDALARKVREVLEASVAA